MGKQRTVERLPIGTKVSYTRFLMKFRGDNRVIWQDFTMPDDPSIGYVVGVRTIREGKIIYDEDGSYFRATNSIRVYLITQTLYTKPIHVPIDAVNNEKNG